VPESVPENQRLTTGWKVVIVLAFLGAVGGGGNAEREARQARDEARRAEVKARQVDQQLDRLEERIKKLEKAAAAR
jgi:hypothetical protein